MTRLTFLSEQLLSIEQTNIHTKNHFLNFSKVDDTSIQKQIVVIYHLLHVKPYQTKTCPEMEVNCSMGAELNWIQ